MIIVKGKYVLTVFVLFSILLLGGGFNPATANIPPTVDAGIDITMSINDVATTSIYGIVIDPDNTGFLKCAWENNLQQLTPLMDVLGSGLCLLELGNTIPANDPFEAAGVYTLILYGLDGSVVASDSMILTLLDSNNGPIANAGPDITITTDQVDTTILQGLIINPYNNDPLRCAWYENGIMQLTPIFDVGPNGECPLDLSTSFQNNWDVGSYTLVLYGIDDSVIYSDTMILTIIPPTNTPATVEAGPDLVITSDEIVTTIINGSVTDPDNTGFLKCAWEDQIFGQLTPLMDVINNTCPLNLSDIISGSFEVGVFTLTLYGLDGSFISSDVMILTIVQPNIAPVADAGINVTISTEEVASTIIQGTATDADGDPLTCKWTEGVNVLLDWTPVGPNGECPLDLSTTSLGIGTYSLFLEVDDGQTISADEMILTIENSPPVADAGATTTNTTCLATSCEITLDGSQSTDPDSTSGTNDDIVSFEWIENAVTIATGEAPLVSLPLGMHDITLLVTDSFGETDHATITVVIDPADLSFLQINKANVKKDGKIKIYGKLALPAGVTHSNINSVGSTTISLSSPPVTAINESAIDFTVSGNGKKWKYHVNPVLGVKKFKIDWAGSKFKYQDVLHELILKTDHIGGDKTELEIKSCAPVTIEINGVTIAIDEFDVVTVTPATIKVDRDGDGDSDDSDSDHGHPTDDDGDCTVQVRLPFALTPNMVFNITYDTGTETVLAGDYFTAAVGKFKIHGRFDATAIDFSSLVPNLELTVALGDEGFAGTVVIDQATWTKIKPAKHWKYKSD